MWPRGIRARLVLAITLVAAATLAISFFVLHQRTGSDLESRIDEQLAGDLQEFENSPAATSRTEGQLARRSRAFVNGQAYHPDSRIFAIEIGDGPRVVTNSEELIEAELGEAEGGERDEGSAQSPTGVLSATPGYETLSAGGDARVRVLTRAGDQWRAPTRHLPRSPVAQPGRDRPGQPPQHVHRDWGDRAGRVAGGGDLDRNPDCPAAGPDGRVRRWRRPRRSRPPPRRRRWPVRGPEPEDVAQPHARSPAAGFREGARVRRRRLARAAHPDHRRPGRTRAVAARRGRRPSASDST